MTAPDSSAATRSRLLRLEPNEGASRKQAEPGLAFARGIGKRLLDAAKAWAQRRSATHLELGSGEARVDAHRFYERELPGSHSVCFGWTL
jgi:Acetyltransferase (GNAT) family